MPWVRRTRHLAIGVVGDGGAPRLSVRSLLTGTATELSAARLEELLAVPAREWTWRTDAGAELLARNGLLVSDEPGRPFEALRRRDTELTALGWRPEAAAFHLATRWSARQARVPGRDGSPPPS